MPSAFASLNLIKDFKAKHLKIFKMTINYNEPTRKFINRELLFLGCYHVDIKKAKCSLQWWGKHESLFVIIGFFGQ
jgi:hypothetical protein